MLTGSTTIQRVSHTIDAEFQNSLIMLDPVGGKFLELSPVAHRIWQLLEHPTTIDLLCSTLQDEFDVPPATCTAETTQLLTKMNALGLLQIHQPTPA